jgi:hypothetical protein
MTTPTDQVVIRDPLSNNLLRDYTQDGSKWNWTWVPIISMAKVFPRDEAERIVQESGQIMYRIETPQDADREMSKGKAPPTTPPAPAPPQVIPLKPPPAPKPMQYDLVGDENLGQARSDINAHLSQGWKLYGPPFVRERLILQAMIREIPA